MPRGRRRSQAAKPRIFPTACLRCEAMRAAGMAGAAQECGHDPRWTAEVVEAAMAVREVIPCEGNEMLWVYPSRLKLETTLYLLGCRDRVELAGTPRAARAVTALIKAHDEGRVWRSPLETAVRL